MLTLYGYWRSSAAYRVRIACHYKKLAFETRAIDLTKDGGQQHLPAYGVLNPNRLVPTLVDGDLVLNQSLAIMEYLDEAYPEPPLLPDGPVARARARALSLNLVSDCHPLNNLRVLKYLSGEIKLTEQQKRAWYHHWIRQAFDGLELQLEQSAGDFCLGDDVSIADVCLVPQVYNAERFEFPMDDYPLISAITGRCRRLDAFAMAEPERQSDAPQSGA